MKITKPENQTAESPKGLPESSNLPSVLELTQVAALLLKDKSGVSLNYTDAANRVIQLWFACEQERETWHKQNLLREIYRGQADWASTSGKIPKKFPMSFDKFLKIALSHKPRQEDRMKIYREFIRANPNYKNQDCSVLLKEHRAGWLDELDYRERLETLRQFANWHGKESLRLRAQAGGKARVAKRKARPPVEKLKSALLTYAERP